MKLTKTHKDLISALDKGDTLRPDGKFYVLANGDSRFTAKTVNGLIEEGLLVRGLVY